jgi:hypothetical protein
MRIREIGDRELRAFVQRFADLSPENQLKAYQLIREALSQPREADTDRDVENKLAALDAMSQVADHLNLKSGVAPTVTQFDEAASALGLSWNKSRVIRVWGRWRFAAEAYRGERSAARTVNAPIARGRDRKTEEYLPALRAWLKSNPVDRSHRAYTSWAKQRNARLASGEERLPIKIPVSHLKVAWNDLKALAEGTLSLAEVQPFERLRSAPELPGPHNLIGTKGVAELLGLSPAGANVRLQRSDFPLPALQVPSVKLWRREDVEAYARGETFPDRVPNELRPLYLTSKEVADRFGCSVSLVINGSPRIPTSAVQMSGVRFWLKADVDAAAGKP